MFGHHQPVGATEGQPEARRIRQVLPQRRADGVDHALRQRMRRDLLDRHVGVVQVHEEARAAHLAQLLDDQQPVGGRQAAEEADRAGRAVRHVLRRRLRLDLRLGAQLAGPDRAGRKLGHQHAGHHHQGQASQQRGRPKACQPRRQPGARALKHWTR